MELHLHFLPKADSFWSPCIHTQFARGGFRATTGAARVRPRNFRILHARVSLIFMPVYKYTYTRAHTLAMPPYIYIYVCFRGRCTATFSVIPEFSRAAFGWNFYRFDSPRFFFFFFFFFYRLTRGSRFFSPVGSRKDGVSTSACKSMSGAQVFFFSLSLSSLVWQGWQMYFGVCVCMCTDLRVLESVWNMYASCEQIHSVTEFALWRTCRKRNALNYVAGFAAHASHNSSRCCIRDWVNWSMRRFKNLVYCSGGCQEV